MNVIEIKNIKEDTFEQLETKLPLLPAGLGSFEIKNPYMLMVWKNKFIELYGEEGTLFLDWQLTGQVEGNENYNRACIATCNHIMDFGILD